jgi:hypothetical protein
MSWMFPTPDTKDPTLCYSYKNIFRFQVFFTGYCVYHTDVLMFISLTSMYSVCIFRYNETVLATDPTRDRCAGVWEGIWVRRWEAIQVVALLRKEEIYGQITVWPWAVMKIWLYIMWLFIPDILRPKLHLNLIHCVYIVGHDNKPG